MEFTAPQLASVVTVANRVCSAIRSIDTSLLIPGKTNAQTISVGVAIAPDHGFDLEKLIQQADEALYEAKHSGRDRAVVAPRAK